LRARCGFWRIGIGIDGQLELFGVAEMCKIKRLWGKGLVCVVTTDIRGFLNGMKDIDV